MNKVIAPVFALMLFVSFSSIVLAQGATVHSDVPDGHTVTGNTQTLDFHLENPLKPEVGDDIPSFLHSLLDKVILPIGEIIIVFMFIFTGFKFVMARGNATELETAKRSLLYTAIGTAILLGAWGISLIITETVNQVIKT